MNYALIRSEKVVNIISTSDPEFIEAIRSEWDHIEPLTPEQSLIVLIGWGWVDGKFVAPPSPEPEIDMRPEIEIKSIESDNPADFRSVRLDSGLWDVTCRAGTTLTVIAELEIAGAKLNVSEQFRMPMRARGSGRTIVLLATMVAGVITITARMDESEIWEVLETAINEALAIEAQMRFDGLTIQALQAV